MPKITLTRRWGPHRAGSSVEVSTTKAAFLKGIGWTDDTPVVNDGGVRPGSDGPDPVVSGDPTRRRLVIPTQERDENQNRAVLAEGAPPVPRRGLTDQPAGGNPVSEGGEDSARGEVSSTRKPVQGSARSQAGRPRKVASPERP